MDVAQDSPWSGQPASVRRQHISQYVAFTPGLTGAMSLIADLWDSWRESPEGEISFIQGETRAGKTTALDEFIIDKHIEFSKRYEGVKGFEVMPLGEDPALWAIEIKTPNGWLRPIVKVQVSKKPKYKSLFADVLSTMGIKRVPESMTVEQRLNLLTTQLRVQETRVMGFDECHHISEFKDPDGIYDAGDVFKIVAKCGRAGVLCCGLPHMMELVDANPQVRECERDRYTVKPFSLDLTAGSDLKVFMTALNQRLPFDEPSCLDQDDVVLRIALLRDCFTGRMAKFVHQVNAYAISIGASCIDVPTLTSFLRIKKGIADEANIFLMSRDAVEAYPANMEKGRRERIIQAENRRAKQAAQRHTKTAFGTRS
ncbi:TniB family NTP-binding protein [Bradyrhizobium sp. USDA 4529]